LFAVIGLCLQGFTDYEQEAVGLISSSSSSSTGGGGVVRGLLSALVGSDSSSDERRISSADIQVCMFVMKHLKHFVNVHSDVAQSSMLTPAARTTALVCSTALA
jgi:hypothetical protein